jgi:hypothetical protein
METSECEIVFGPTASVSGAPIRSARRNWVRSRARGKGQQKMTVEHVHVYPGGQAVVGVVEGPAGTNHLKSGETRNDRQIAHAPQPAMRSANPEREAVPIASDAERPVPDARRQVTGTPEGERMP